MQAKDLPEYFAHAEPKTGRPSRAAVERALKEALAGYLHDRPRIDVAYPRLAGKSFRVEKTELRFVKRPGPHGVKLREAVTSGPIHFVAGGYDDEGLVFEIVLHETKKGFDVLGAFVAER